jgi:hypothetical protein
MSATYTPIASATLEANATQIIFSSIPSTYTDLVLVAQSRSTNAAASDILSLQLNSDTGNNYSYTRLQGDGSSASGARESNLNLWRINYNIPGATATANVFGLDTIQIINYSNTTTNKSALWRSNPSQILTGLSANLWRNTAAINSIRIFATFGSLVSGSTFNLYGILGANA